MRVETTGRFGMRQKYDSTIVIVVNPKGGWILTDGKDLRTMGSAELEKTRDRIAIEWLTTLVPFAHESFSVSRVDSLTGLFPAVLRVKRANSASVDLAFDTKTALLKATISPIGSQGIDIPASLRREVYYSDYQSFGGLLHWTTRAQYLNPHSIRQLDAQVVDLQFPEELDDSLFMLPSAN